MGPLAIALHRGGSQLIARFGIAAPGMGPHGANRLHGASLVPAEIDFNWLVRPSSTGLVRYATYWFHIQSW